MAQTLCAWFKEISRDDVPLAGGKGANLGDMVQAGLPVPPGFVVCVPAYQQIAKSSGLEAKLDELTTGLDRSDSDQLREIEQQAQQLFEHVSIEGELRQLIVDCYYALDDNVPVAVRSSATTEDLAGASFAGQQRTFLNVVGQEELINAVRHCWASLYTSQAIFYRHQKGFDTAPISMAVVIQKMITSEKSGVLFTVDPVLRDYSQMVIESVWGLGEAIVSGTITPDHYKVDRETYEIVYELVTEQQSMVVKDENGGIITLPVPPDKVSKRVLTPAELRQLVDLGHKVDQHFGQAQDVEWGIEGDQIYLLQSRPVTNL
jgi:pyruvate,water dikinase